MLPFILCAGLLGAFAVWLIIFGVNQKKQNDHLREICTMETTGIVNYTESGSYSVNSQGERHDSRRAFPVFVYTGYDRYYTHTTKRYDSNGKRRYTAGQQVVVFHAPDDPQKNYIPTEDATQNALTCIIFGSALLAFIVFAGVRAINLQ